ncbi:MAG: glycosyltransferase [Gaiellales bacterium]
MAESTAPLALLLCDRSIPAVREEWPTLALAFADIGEQVVIADDDPGAVSGCDAVVLYGNTGWYPRLGRYLRSVPRSERPLVAVYFAEPLPPPRASGLPRFSPLNAAEVKRVVLRDPGATDIYTNARKLRRAMREGWVDVVFVTGLEKQEYLAEQGIPSWTAQYGYHPSLGRLLDLERSIDVLFLGWTGPRRRRRLIRFLRRSGIDVDVRGSWSDPSLWGEGRTQLLNRTKIVVHLQRYPGKTAAMRFVLALANGAMVVAEPCYRPDPFVPGVHYAQAPIGELPDTIRYYLDHPEERERIVAAGHRLVTEQLTFARTAETIVSVIREQLARPSA